MLNKPGRGLGHSCRHAAQKLNAPPATVAFGETSKPWD